MKTIALALAKINTKKLQLAFLFFSMLIIEPFFLHNQWYTGTLVNSILIMTLLMIGLKEAVLFCFIPSVVVFASGALPAPLSPVLPFIIVSNLVLILSLFGLKKLEIKNFFALPIAAFAKFAFLYGSFAYLMSYFISENLLAKTASIFGITQLFTALLGGLFATSVAKMTNGNKNF